VNEVDLSAGDVGQRLIFEPHVGSNRLTRRGIDFGNQVAAWAVEIQRRLAAHRLRYSLASVIVGVGGGHAIDGGLDEPVVGVVGVDFVAACGQVAVRVEGVLALAFDRNQPAVHVADV